MTPATHGRLTIKTLRTGASRVLLPSGELFGYVIPEHDGSAHCFRACIHRSGTALTRDIGIFSRFEDALDSLDRMLS